MQGGPTITVDVPQPPYRSEDAERAAMLTKLREILTKEQAARIKAERVAKRLKDRMADINERFGAIRRHRDELKDEYTAMAKERDELHNKLGEANREYTAVAKERDELKAKIEVMIGERDELVLDNLALERRVEQLRDQQKKPTDLSALETSHRELEAMCETLFALNSKLWAAVCRKENGDADD